MMLRRRVFQPLMVLALTALVAPGCSDLIETDPPTGVGATTPDPDAFNNEQGALELYKGAVNKFREATSGRITPGGYIVMSGMLGDELSAGRFNTPTNNSFTSTTLLDSRRMSGTETGSLAGYEEVWRQLHGVRMQAMTSIEALRRFGPNHPRDLTGHLFALWGMAEVMLANFFCSGIPLTTVDFEGSLNYAAGSTTEEVYRHAIAMFDSALANTPDSVNYQNLAKIGKGWALLNLGEYDAAAQTVATVPTDFVYKNLHSHAVVNAVGTPNFTAGISTSTPHQISDMGTVADREGGVGLPYRSSGDPRTISPEVRAAVPSSGEDVVYKPARWMVDGGNTPIIMASGVEARLIEAEAALAKGNGEWLNILNRLRTEGTYTIEPVPGQPGVEDTIWALGAGAVLFTSVGAPIVGLPLLEDPGTPDGRVDLLFQERAYWLFLTGRRHADMRRLIRQYGRPETTVFPQGAYPAGPIGSYGTDVNAPAPASEMVFNLKYKGCFDRQA